MGLSLDTFFQSFKQFGPIIIIHNIYIVVFQFQAIHKFFFRNNKAHMINLLKTFYFTNVNPVAHRRLGSVMLQSSVGTLYGPDLSGL